MCEINGLDLLLEYVLIGNDCLVERIRLCSNYFRVKTWGGISAIGLSSLHARDSGRDYVHACIWWRLWKVQILRLPYQKLKEQLEIVLENSQIKFSGHV